MTSETKGMPPAAQPEPRGALPDAPLSMPKQVLTKASPSLLSRLFRPAAVKAGH